MKYIALVTIGICTVILTIAFYRPGMPAKGCANVHSSPLGTMMEGPNAKSRLHWDDSCASGVGWTAK